MFFFSASNCLIKKPLKRESLPHVRNPLENIPQLAPDNRGSGGRNEANDEKTEEGSRCGSATVSEGEKEV